MRYYMIQVFSFHSNWTLTVAMATDNGLKNRLTNTNVILSQTLEVEQASLHTKRIYEKNDKNKLVTYIVINILKFLVFSSADI